MKGEAKATRRDKKGRELTLLQWNVACGYLNQHCGQNSFFTFIVLL